jgi:hypothetical protein
MSKQYFRKQHALAAAGKRPRMTPSKAPHISRLRPHALQKAKHLAEGGAEAYVDEAPLVGVGPTISSNPARSLGTPSASFAAAT